MATPRPLPGAVSVVPSTSDSPSPLMGSLSLASAPPASASLSLSAHARRLFCTMSVPQLKQMAEEQRNASEDKKEELRQLVGLRYRVLIETADSILSMRGLVEDTRERLQQLHDVAPTVGLGSGTELALPAGPTRPTPLHLLLLLRSYALAPASVWTSLDAHDYEGAISMVLRMRGVRAQLEALEQGAVDMADVAAQPELQRLIDTALTSLGGSSAAAQAASGSSPSLVLGASLRAFLQHHASYHAELPNLIARAAFTRMSEHSALDAKEYADCITALALLLQPDTPDTASGTGSASLGVQLLDAFLDSKRVQLHGLVSSAESALTAFRTQAASESSRLPLADATPILVHACQHVLYTLQHTMLDLSLLFSAITVAENPNARFVSSSASMAQEWKQCNVAERVRTFWKTKTEGADAKEAAQAQAVGAAVTIDPSLLASRVSSWLHDTQSFLSQALEHRLFPFLLPVAPSASTSTGRRRRVNASTSSSGSSSWTSLQRLREEILRAANFEQLSSAVREEGATLAAERARKQKIAEVAEEKDNDPAGGPVNGDGSNIPSLAPSLDDEARMRRKRMMERWEYSCTLLFGQQPPIGPPSGSSVAAPSFGGSPLSLFDCVFLPPLCSFTRTMARRAFERLTLLQSMEKFLQPPPLPVATTTALKEDASTGEKDRSQGRKSQTPRLQKSESKEKQGDDEFSLSNLRAGTAAVANSGAPAIAPSPPTDLHGARESEVQQLVALCRRQLRQLGKECRALLECSYVQRTAAASSHPAQGSIRGSADQTPTAAPAGPLLFPALARFLHDELTPLLSKHFTQLVETLGDQLKKKLADLERTVLQSMADVSEWRSADTQQRVERSVFLGRVCHELLLHPQLLSIDALLGDARLHRSTPPTSTIGQSPLCVSLSGTAQSAFRVWTRYVAAVLSEDLGQALTDWSATQREMQRQGEKHAAADQQQRFSSKDPFGGPALSIPLPVHASSHVLHLLLQLQTQYYSLLGFRVHTRVLAWLLGDVGRALLATLETHVLSSQAVAAASGGGGSASPLSSGASPSLLSLLPPSGVLQLLFDVHYLFAAIRLDPKETCAVSLATPPSAARFDALLRALHAECARVQVPAGAWLPLHQSAVSSNARVALQRSALLLGLLWHSNPFPALPAEVRVSDPARVAESDAAAPASSASALSSLLPLAAPIARIQPLSASLYPSRIPQVQPAAGQTSQTALHASSQLRSTVAPSTRPAAPAASLPSSSPPPAAASLFPASSAGVLSFSSLGAQLGAQRALANSAVHAKAIGDQAAQLGTQLLGKLGAHSLWGASSNKQ